MVQSYDAAEPFAFSSPYRTRRKSSLSNVPFTLSQSYGTPPSQLMGMSSSTPQPSKDRCCFRCQKLIDHDDIKIGPGLESVLIKPSVLSPDDDEAAERAEAFFGRGDTDLEEEEEDRNLDPLISSAYSTPITSPNSSFSASPSFSNSRHSSLSMRIKSNSSNSGNSHSYIRQRRRSSQPLTTSFQESLLTGRTSGFPSKPIPFVAKLVINEFDPVTEKPIISNKEYARSSIPFELVYYNWPNDAAVDKRDSPYVGTVDLDNFFIEREIDKLRTCSKRDKNQKRSFPGFIIPECFLLQLLLINDQHTVSECLFFKYNLRPERLNNGEKTFLRKNLYIVNVEKHFISTVQINVAKLKGKYILFNNIKVIFHNKILPIMASGNETVSSTESLSLNSGGSVIKQSEVLKGGKSKIPLPFYKKCEYCGVINDKILALDLTTATQDPFKLGYSLSSSGSEASVAKKQDHKQSSPPSPSLQISKKLLFGKFAPGQDQDYQNSQVFQDDDDGEEEISPPPRADSFTFRSRRGSFMF